MNENKESKYFSIAKSLNIIIFMSEVMFAIGIIMNSINTNDNKFMYVGILILPVAILLFSVITIIIEAAQRLIRIENKLNENKQN